MKIIFLGMFALLGLCVIDSKSSLASETHEVKCKSSLDKITGNISRKEVTVYLTPISHIAYSLYGITPFVLGDGKEYEFQIFVNKSRIISLGAKLGDFHVTQNNQDSVELSFFNAATKIGATISCTLSEASGSNQ